MSLVKVNDNQITEGKFSIEIWADTSSKPIILHKRGVFETNIYIDEITSLENERYLVQGIQVYKEAFGSEEDTVSYEFTFTDMKQLMKK